MDRGKGKIVAEEDKEKAEERRGESTRHSSSTEMRINAVEGNMQGEEEAGSSEVQISDRSALDMSSLESALPEKMGMPMKTIKLLILGFKGVGKSTLVKSHNGQLANTAGEFFVDFQTHANGMFRFLCAESENIDLAKICTYEAFMILFDLTHKYSYTYMKTLYGELDRNCNSDETPIVLVGNKNDSTHNIVMKNIAAGREFGLPLYLISARNKVDSHKPFLSLARSIIRVPSLALVEDVPTITSKAPSPKRVSPVLDLAAAETYKPPPQSTSARKKLVETARTHPARNSLRIRGNNEEVMFELLEEGQRMQSQCCYL